MRWPLGSFIITQGFHGINTEYNYDHWGTDLAANEGVDIKAPESGVITAVNSGWKKGGYFGGNYVKMTGDSGYSYYMGHMSSTAATSGKRVNQDDVIGKVGSTGQATGPHVHFEMYKDGKAVDATKIIRGASQGGEAMIQDKDNEYGRWNKLGYQIRGRNLSREEFRKAAVGRTWLEALEILADNPESDRATRAQEIGQLAIKDNWEGQIRGLLAQLKAIPQNTSDAEKKLQSIKDALK